MKNTVLRAKEYLSILPIYVCLDDTIEDALLKMFEFKLSKILVCDKKFLVTGMISKKDIINFFDADPCGISRDLIRKYRVFDIIKNISGEFFDNKKFASAYLESDLGEVTNAMKALGANYMPVLKSPWNRTLKGFIEFKNVENVQNLCIKLRHFL